MVSDEGPAASERTCLAHEASNKVRNNFGVEVCRQLVKCFMSTPGLLRVATNFAKRVA